MLKGEAPGLDHMIYAKVGNQVKKRGRSLGEEELDPLITTG